MKLKLAIYTLFFLISIGTFFYHYSEGWSYIDSFYFTSITLSTIGYGDLHPTSALSKIFTSVFAFTGVSVAIYALTIIGADYFTRRESSLIQDLKSGKSQDLKTELLKADQHIMKMDQHVLEVLRRIDKRIKK